MRQLSEQKGSSSLQGIKISDVQFRFVEHGRDGLVAWVSLVLGNSIALSNIALRRGREGSYFLTFPAKRTSSGSRFYYFHPVDKESSDDMLTAVLRAVGALVEGALNDDIDSGGSR